MTGRVIPEQVFSKADYHRLIFEPINKAIKPHDTEKILDHHFLNSRGAIARFDRNAIEIRVIDIQECPKADLAVAVLIIEVLKLLVSEELVSLEDQKDWNEEELFPIFERTVQEAEQGSICNERYLDLFDLKNDRTTAGQLWRHLYEKVRSSISSEYQEALDLILEQGSLSSRILKALGTDFKEPDILRVYTELSDCLAENRLFRP